MVCDVLSCSLSADLIEVGCGHVRLCDARIALLMLRYNTFFCVVKWGNRIVVVARDVEKKCRLQVIGNLLVVDGLFVFFFGFFLFYLLSEKNFEHLLGLVFAFTVEAVGFVEFAFPR